MIIEHEKEIGYMHGVWHGVLMSYGIPVDVVHPLKWKRGLNLISKKKEGSLDLAKLLFPVAEDLFK